MSNFDSINPNARHFSANEFAPAPKKRRKIWKWLVVILILGAIGFTGYKFLARTNQVFLGKQNIFQRLSSLFLSPDKKLIGEEEGEVNILLLGVGGSGHDGGYLTDTMIVASINPETKEVVLTSIPRDFALDLPKIGYNKVNSVYAYAYLNDPDTAGDEAIAAAEKITGFEIPYYAVVDFKGFVKAVDNIGGVDVTIERTFTDATFPNDYPFDTKGYISPVTFTKGTEHMNGTRALIFARSRHSENQNEGSDFARSERQKKIIVAVKDKVLDLNLTQLTTINNLLSDFTENFRTNLEPHELKRLGDLAKNIDSSNIYSLSLEPEYVLICEALVDPKTGKRLPAPAPTPAPTPTPTPTTTKPVTPTPTPVPAPKPGTPTPTPAPAPVPVTPTEPEIIRMYVIQPCEGKTLADIQEFMRNATLMAKLRKEGAVVEIQNSTGKASAATKFNRLNDMGMDVKLSTFLGKVPYDQTIFYDNSQGAKPNSINYLRENYTFTESDVSYPASSADFVIVLGKDSL